jgi:hypothetical protein
MPDRKEHLESKEVVTTGKPDDSIKRVGCKQYPENSEIVTTLAGAVAALD